MLKPMQQLIVALSLSSAVAGCAQPAHMDTAIGSVMTPGNTQVPLPPGDWRQIAIERHSGGKYTHGGINNSQSVDVSYALVENGSVKSLANIFTSAGAPQVYDPNQDCRRSSRPEWTYLHEVDGDMTNNSDCIKVEKVTAFNPPNEGSTPFYGNLYRAAAELGGLPRSAVRVLFADSLNFRYLNCNIFFFPERDGVQGDHWRVGEEGAVEKAYVDEIVSWAKKFRPAVRNGVQNQLQ